LLVFDAPTCIDEHLTVGSGTAIEGSVLYVAHTGHEETRQRGSSDFESYYKSKLTLVENGGKRILSTDHREAEGTGPYELAFRFDGETRSLRIAADEGDIARKVREYVVATTQGYLQSRKRTHDNRRYVKLGRREVQGQAKPLPHELNSCSQSSSGSSAASRSSRIGCR